jgi:predicted RNA-binding protein (virulence factor B family)
MIQLGAFHTLEVVREEANGLRLGEDAILLPRSQVPPDAVPGDTLEVFVYEGRDGRPVATTATPKAKVGEFAFLRVVDSSGDGVYADWGLDKDLLIPRSEQYRPLRVGRSYVVAITTDAQGRVMGSNKIREFFDDDTRPLKAGQEVDLMAFELHELGMKVIVDGRWEGMVFSDDIYQRLRVGDCARGKISRIRGDGKLDIALRERGHAGMQVGRDALSLALEAAGGYLPLHDRTPPEVIRRELSMSKKAFKRAVGNLLKAGRIELEAEGIRLREPEGD